MAEEKKKKTASVKKKTVGQKSKSGSKKQPVKKDMKSSQNEYSPALKKYYNDVVVEKLMKKFKYKTSMQVPKLTKITLNMGVGDAKTNAKSLESAVKELTAISGQKAVVTKAKRDVSNFKIRKGFPVGTKVTLRSGKMYEFFERLNSIALPRTRDFTGLSFKSFDGRGNYSFGIKEQIVFTEIEYDNIDTIRGLDVAIGTTAKTDDECYWLLKSFGFPLREKPVKTKEIEEKN